MGIGRGGDNEGEDVEEKGELGRYGIRVVKKGMAPVDTQKQPRKKRTKNIAAALPGLSVPPWPLLDTLIQVVSRTVQRIQEQDTV